MIMKQRLHRTFWQPTTLLVCLMLVSLAGCSTDNWEGDTIPPDSGRIQAGQAMFGIPLNSKFEALRIAYGRQDYFDVSTARPYTFFATWEDLGLSVYVEDVNRNGKLEYEDVVREMFAFFPYQGTTPGGVQVGSIDSRVFDEFGTSYTRDGSWIRYNGQGIGFFVSEGFVFQIHVYPPLF